MSKDMLGIVVRKLVTLPLDVLGIVCDLLEKLADPEWVSATKRFLRKENPWPELQKAASRLLVLVKEIEQPAIAAFSPLEKFRVTSEKDRKTTSVVIGCIDPNLHTLMESRGIEPGRDAETFRINFLAATSSFASIFVELGEKAKTTFGRVWQMIEKQGHGQEGDLLVNGYANFFPIEGTDQVLSCIWHPDFRYWYFYGYPISYSREWSAGRRWVSLADS